MWGDPAFGEVAASGRSLSLLNLDWIARNGGGYGPRRDKPAPAAGFINTEWTHGAVINATKWRTVTHRRSLWNQLRSECGDKALNLFGKSWVGQPLLQQLRSQKAHVGQAAEHTHSAQQWRGATGAFVTAHPPLTAQL